MNYVNFFWSSLPRKMIPKPTALPRVEQLKNLTAWSRHLSFTRFAPVLWVNQVVFDEIKSLDAGHVIVSDDASIRRVLPINWHDSYTGLAKKVRGENIIFWKKRARHNNYHTLPADMNILVVNVQGYFKFLSKFLTNFKTVLALFEQLINARLFVFIKDRTVDFLVSHFGGFYFDLDIAPNIEVPFFYEMDSIKKSVINYPKLFELKESGHILALLKRDKNFENDVDLDVGMKLNIGATSSLSYEKNYKELSLIMTQKSIKKFNEKLKEYRLLIEQSAHQKIKALPIDKRLEWSKLYQEDMYQFLEELYFNYPLKKMLEKTDEIPFLDAYMDVLYTSLDPEPLSTYAHSNKPNFDEWLINIYGPFYDLYLKDKFSQVDANIPSCFSYTGFEVIETQTKARQVLSEHMKETFARYGKENIKHSSSINVIPRQFNPIKRQNIPVRKFGSVLSTMV